MSVLPDWVTLNRGEIEDGESRNFPVVQRLVVFKFAHYGMEVSVVAIQIEVE
jgi:hypothetical protein